MTDSELPVSGKSHSYMYKSDSGSTATERCTNGGDSRSTFYVPEPPENVSELFADISNQNESTNESTKENTPNSIRCASLTVLKDGSPVLSSPATLDYDGGNKDKRKRDGTFSLSSDESPYASKKWSEQESDVSQMTSDQDGDRLVQSEEEEEDGGSDVEQNEEEMEAEESDEETDNGESFIDHSATMSSTVSNLSEKEEEISDTSDTQEDAVPDKSFTTYRTVSQEDSDTDGEEEQKEGSDEDGASDVEGRNSDGEDASVLYYSCTSAGTPASPDPSKSDERKDKPSLSNHSKYASPLPLATEKENKKLNPSPTNGCSYPPPVSASIDKKFNSSPSNSHSSIKDSSISPVDADPSPPVVLDSFPMSQSMFLSGTCHNPVTLSPDITTQQHSMEKPRSLQTTGGAGGGSDGCGGSDGGAGGGCEAAVVEEEKQSRDEPQFQVGYQYRTVVRQLMETNVSL